MLYQYVPDERDNCDCRSMGKQTMATLECYEEDQILPTLGHTAPMKLMQRLLKLQANVPMLFFLSNPYYR